MRELKILATADIHIEQLIQHNPDMLHKYYKYFEDCIIKYQPDIFCILGDYIHKSSIQAESKEYLFATQFLLNLASLTAKYPSIHFIMIRGTLSHDGEVVKNMIYTNSQLSNIKYFDEIKVIKHNGYSILLLPEVTYPTHDKLIEDLKLKISEPVDIILYHNMFDFAIPFLKQVNSNYNLGRSVVINSKIMQQFFKIVAIGGHVHDDISYENIYYTGQFINEVGKISKSHDRYGLRFLHIKNDEYQIKTLPNPHYIENKQCVLDFNEISFDLLLNMARSYDVNNTIFILKNIDRKSPHILEFKKIIKPKYIKIIPLQDLNDNNQQQMELKIQPITSSEGLINMLNDLYAKKHLNKIPEEVINEIKNYNKD